MPDRIASGCGRTGYAIAAVLGATLLTGCGTTAAPVRPTATRPSPSAARTHRRTAPSGAAGSASEGRLVARTIPGGRSGFGARSAVIWLPPALATEPSWRPPVLELLHGTPGGPNDWVDLGGAQATFAAFAARHGGRAPIVVMPDINGTPHGDPECIRTPAGGDVEDYLSAVLPQWIRSHYRTSGRRWAIAGVSEGGTCSAVLALRHPSQYGVFGDLSGLARPTVGDTDDSATTIRVLFDGSRAAYDRHDPLWLLAHYRYPTLSGWIEYGAADTAVRLASTAVAAEARTAGIDIRQTVAAGRHSWSVWRPALAAMLPWIWTRLA